MRKFVSFFFAVVVCAVGLGVGPSALAEPGCGSSVPSSFTFTHDIGPCPPGGGLTVSGDNVTINMNGYKLFGGGATGDGNGISVTGRTNVTIKNGKIGRFDEGIKIVGSSNTHIVNVRLLGNVGDGSSTGDGIWVTSSSNETVVSHCVFRSNGPLTGMFVDGSSAFTKVIKSVFDANDGMGLQIDGAASGTLVKDTTISGSSQTGLQVANTTGARASGNVVSDNGLATGGSGIAVYHTTFSNFVSNVARENGGDGILAASSASGLTFKDNHASQNGVVANTAVDLEDQTAGCTTNTWHGNTGKTYNQTCVLAP